MKQKKPVSVDELEEHFSITSSQAFKELIHQLNELEETGQVVRTRTNRYGTPDKLNLIKGRVQGHAKALLYYP